jgi:hypothetical protein
MSRDTGKRWWVSSRVRHAATNPPTLVAATTGRDILPTQAGDRLSAPGAGWSGHAISKAPFLSPDDPKNPRFRDIWCVLPERRANVTLLAALMMPAFVGAAGLGVEASNWGVLQSEMQRSADAGARAAALVYQSTVNAQTAANAAADVVELNGITGASSRTWNSSTSTLTDNLITVTKVSGIRTASDSAFEVTIQRAIPLALAKLFISGSTITVASASWAEIVVAPSTQPCVTALSTTSSAITLSGSATINAPTCAVRSNGGASLSGSSSITAASIYTGRTISGSGSASVSGTKAQNAGTIADPYASYSPVQNAIKQLSGSGGTNENLSGSNTATIAPGTYSSISTSGLSQLTMQPGLYIVNGNLSFSGKSIAGSGVTIVSSGTMSVSGSTAVTLSAPGTTPTGGAVSGVGFVTTSTGTVDLSGSGGLMLTGVIYAPKALINISGSAGYGSTSCLELISNTITISGSASLGGSCTSMGALAYGASNATTVALVQ